MAWISLVSGACLAAFSAGAAQCHEFWIAPERFRVAAGERVSGHLRVGQDFEGAPQSYMPRNFRRFEMATGDDLVAVDGRMGDRPALDIEAAGEGLAVILHVTRDFDLAYDSFGDFARFVASKGADWVLDAHAARGLGDGPPTEIYSRYAKSLVAVGAGEGQDRRFGLATEIVALENPYTDPMDDGLEVQVFLEGAPRVDAQVEIFSRSEADTVEMNLGRTNDEGIATIDVAPGHTYLVNAAALRAPGPEAARTGAMWESLWASLTFALPRAP